jgi:glycosyltransferase involved in cell wall biosynthesis
MPDKVPKRGYAIRRIVFVNRFYAPDHSATAQILTDLAEYLAAQNWAVEIITSRLIYGVAGASLKKRAIINGVAITRIWTVSGIRLGLVGRLLAYLTFYLSAGLALLGALRPGTIVVVKTDPPLIGLVALAASRVKGAKLVNWVQDLYPEIAIEMGVRGLRGPIGAVLRGLRDLSLRRAAFTIAIGHRMSDRIRTRGVPSNRIAIIPNWSDDEAIVPLAATSPDLRREWGLPIEAFVLAYSGNLGPCSWAVGMPKRRSGGEPRRQAMNVLYSSPISHVQLCPTAWRWATRIGSPYARNLKA